MELDPSEGWVSAALPGLEELELVAEEEQQQGGELRNTRAGIAEGGEGCASTAEKGEESHSNGA